MISFLSVFPPYRGGIARFSDYLYRHIAEYETINAFNFKKLYPDILFPGTTQFSEENTKGYGARVLHSYNPLSWNTTAKEIAENQPDWLLVSYWHPFFIPACNRIIKKLKKISPQTKTAAIAHNVKPHESFPFSKLLMKRFFELNDLVITLSEQTGQELTRLADANRHIQLFHPVYDTRPPAETEEELKKKYGFTSDDRIVLFFGLVRSYKGLDVLIDAVKQIDLNGHGIKVLVAGEFYDEKEKYSARIKPEQKQCFTILDRFVTQQEASEIFKLSDLLVLPYKTASQSGVLADALNFELPAVVSDHPGLTEFIRDDENGMIFENKNAGALAEKIQKYFSDEILRDSMRSELGKLKQELSWGNFTRKLLNELK